MPAAATQETTKLTTLTTGTSHHEIVTPLTTKKKGKGVAMSEEPDPDSMPSTNSNPLPTTGPVLLGSHTENPSSPAAPTSASRMPTPSKGVSKSPAAPRSASNSKSTYTNKAKVFYDIKEVKGIPIWVEPISESMNRMYGAFNPAVDEDVLVPLGAIDGVLPGRTKEECDCLRCAVEMVYKMPRDCRWEFIGSAIKDFAAYKPSREELVRYTGQGIHYRVKRTRLLQVAQVVVTVDQILQVLAEFFNKQERDRFILNQGFSFLRLLAYHTSRTEILATYRVLQYRTTVASKHLIQEINTLTRMYRTETDKMSISSYESSRSSLRSLYGAGSARKEVGKLLARPEYFNRMPEDLIEIAAYLRDRAYKDLRKPQEFSVHRSHVLRDNDGAKSATSRSSTTPTNGPTHA
ncbi:uncharacterized protein LACBIDRAFT_331090 [Laccaria bicolor S238N-H82]|uniref:Predicted protein n=1 Tax=Laccaria bicolor (strain S238N-H82 / ATCC MYA-4686) TaxID=486041 RepID=B0DNG1_LACBS|nr:uncharacterized protein LACBIDRAFT_331090 [Laccaria bicolor S238N-H82]EDR03934.1 predicted protein [Laccaria bicolor S238N-H82]|eukprot:XP_001885502.1 predicted protein [Laccaria bicolor S238N-H82]